MLKKLFFTLLLPLGVGACSPVDSLKVFDQNQAAAIFAQNYMSIPAKQAVTLRLPQREQWEKIIFPPWKKAALVMYVPANETALHWNQSIQTRIYAYANNESITARRFSQGEISHAYRQCSVHEAVILSESTAATVYKISMNGCTEEDDQVQIGKVFNGTDAAYAVIYIARTNKIANQQIAIMQKVIEEAKLIRAR